MSRRLTGVLAGGIAAIALLGVVGWHASSWVGRPFPGFLLVSNRVVPSIHLPDWADGRASSFFQHEVIALDGVPISSAADAYARVAADPPGTPIRYTFRSVDGRTFEAVVPSQRFSGTDFVLIFGAYLMSAFAFFFTALLLFFLKPGSRVAFAVFCSGILMGLFVATAGDLYGPWWWFVRLHIAAEALVAPGFLHLTLVFPTDRLARITRRRLVLAALYVPFVALALTYEVCLDSPVGYTRAHLVATAAHALAAVVLIAAVVRDFLRSDSPLVRRRSGVLAVGGVGAFVVPALTMTGSALLGGHVSVNLGALTIFVFPVSLAYAVIKQDLFEIDVFLRRATTYVVVQLLVGTLFFVLLSVAGLLVAGQGAGLHSSMALAFVNLSVLFLIAPLQARILAVVDRLFFRQGYDAEQALSELSQALVTAGTVEKVVTRAEEHLARTISAESVGVFLWSDEQTLGSAHAGRQLVAIMPPDLATRLRRGERLARYEWDDAGDAALPAVWRDLHAELIVPIGAGSDAIGALVLATKGSGSSYNVHDAAFLTGAASQVAMAMSNVRAFAQLAVLNASLERQVQERTAALELANRELAGSLEKLRAAYQLAERNRASLIRADRLATLGRLTAGIAHEVNTPLGAIISALAMLRKLGREYEESIDDPTVAPTDHHAIARDVIQTVESAAGWARKAASFINQVRVHSRDTPVESAAPFTLAAVVAETKALLSHRLRTSDCRIDFVGQACGIELVGEPGRLTQVLVNLVTNAIDAYEERGHHECVIEICATLDGDTLLIAVSDRAGGIAPSVLPHIFDELFTTKEPGRGTGLGLWIATNMVEQSFGGKLAVEAEFGVGSCFTVALPLRPWPAHSEQAVDA